MKAFLVAMLLLAAAAAQDAAPPAHQGGAPEGTRVVTMTRPMAIVSGLENDLEEALAKSDQASLDKLVTGDFSLWAPSPSGDPVPRADWLKQAPASLPIERRQLSVESLSNGEVFVAKFVATGTGPKPGPSRFIVDVWTKAGDSYQLAARYESKIETSARKTRRPSGKE